jgi:predicted transcriptional regulator
MARGAKHKPTIETRAQVSALKSYGHTQEEISSFLNICKDTLTYYYSRELEIAQVNANAEVARRLYNRAVKKDDLSAQIFWLKTRARWRTEDVETLHDMNETLREELRELRQKLDSNNKKDF